MMAVMCSAFLPDVDGFKYAGRRIRTTTTSEPVTHFTNKHKDIPRTADRVSDLDFRLGLFNFFRTTSCLTFLSHSTQHTSAHHLLYSTCIDTLNIKIVKMPELVEVENFRRILLRLKSNANIPLHIELPSPTVPKVFPDESQIETVKRCLVKDVERKGKLLRLVLQQTDTEFDDNTNIYLYLHMGMTGRISTLYDIPSLESLAESDSFPPPHTHIIFTLGEERVAFSDPRRFGAVSLGDPLSSQWEEFAQDALHASATLEKLVGQKKGVKGLLLDQRAIVSGVGNWIADEILYQSRIHPDQSYLSSDEVQSLQESLSLVLKTALQCLLIEKKEYPEDWLFHRRWSKGKASIPKDCNGKNVKFVKSGGRSSAIVASVQKLYPRKKISESPSETTDLKPANNEKQPNPSETNDLKAANNKKQPSKRKVKEQSNSTRISKRIANKK